MILFGTNSALISKKNLIVSLFLKNKINPYIDEITYFYDEETPKVYSNHTCLIVISLNSTLRKDENYFLQVFLREIKYIEKKLIRHANDILNDFFSSHKSDEE